jgi:hypothetical protein
VHNILEGWRYQIDCISEDMIITQNDNQLSQNIEQFWDIMPHPFVNSYHSFSKPCSFYIQEYWGNNQLLWYDSQFTSQHGVTYLKTLSLSVKLWKTQIMWNDRFSGIHTNALYHPIFLLLYMGSSTIITLRSWNFSVFFANTFPDHQAFHLLVIVF